MTNVEAIREDLRPYPIRTSQIERQCAKHGLIPDATTSDEKSLSICVVEILAQMLVLKSVSEGGVSLSFADEKDIRSLIRRKCKEAGLDYTDYVSMTIIRRLE